MKFRLDIEAAPAECVGLAGDLELNFTGSTSVQVTNHPNQIYDSLHRVTWTHNGRAYEATICRVREHAVGGH